MQEQNQIKKPLHYGLILELEQKPAFVNALTVAENSAGKKRLVLDIYRVT